MKQGGWSLLETMFSMFFIGFMMFIVIDVLNEQQHLVCKLNTRMKDIYNLLTLYQELNHLSDEMRPLFCGMQGQIHEDDQLQTYQVGGLEVFSLSQQKQQTYLRIWASKGDMIPLASKKHTHIPDCRKDLYLLTDFKQSVMIQVLDCISTAPIFSEQIPSSLKAPFFVIPVYYKEYVIKKDKILLHAKGVPQVLFSGFESLKMRLRSNHLEIFIKLHHLVPFSWQYQLCSV